MHTRDADGLSSPATSLVGPLGSTVHVLRADAETIAELAVVDWNRHFRRVCLDPVRALITLMAPSHLHENLTGILEDIVSMAADALGRTSTELRSTRLCPPGDPPGDPPGTGMEPDCAFYIGERAEKFRTALAEGESAAEAFLA